MRVRTTDRNEVRLVVIQPEWIFKPVELVGLDVLFRVWIQFPNGFLDQAWSFKLEGLVGADVDTIAWQSATRSEDRYVTIACGGHLKTVFAFQVVAAGYAQHAE